MARHRKNRSEPVKVPAQPKGFRKVNPNAAGIDCGSDEHYVAVPEDRDAQPVRRFGAFTADLIALAAWLQACRVDTVAIESTGVYWIPLYEILEARYYHAKLGELDEQIESHLKTFADKSAGVPLPPRTLKKRSLHANQPRFDVRQYVVQLSGVDLTTLDGFKSGYAALDLISEIGTDMSAWPTVKHFASWLGLCPGIKKTGGRRLSGRRPKKAVRAANILRLAAYPLVNAKCALGAFLRRLRAKLGMPKAITATAHKLARIVYRMLKYGKAYSDVGVEYYERRYRESRRAGTEKSATPRGRDGLRTALHYDRRNPDARLPRGAVA